MKLQSKRLLLLKLNLLIGAFESPAVFDLLISLPSDFKNIVLLDLKIRLFLFKWIRPRSIFQMLQMC